MLDDEAVGQTSAAEERAKLIRASRLFEARLLAGDLDAEESIEAEAGAILEAETATEVHELHAIATAWFEANKKS